MANLAAAVAAAASRDPAVDRSLRSVFGEYVKVNVTCSDTDLPTRCSDVDKRTAETKSYKKAC